ncbi:MAG: hypothetical protein E6Q06_00980 [Candidatus Moraniibacteriota bacterium]|nr:MAG: hypothetical protein E6Q06_00980 [Candidatus Moranbacteria bacterium]
MCYKVVSGQNPGIRALRCDTPLPLATKGPAHDSRLSRAKTAVSIPSTRIDRCYHGRMCISSVCRESMSWGWLSDLECRRYRRTDHERGKRQRKSGHKPDWRGYEKY